MRTIFLIMVAVLLTATVTAQVPQRMSYQAIIRNDKDSLVRNQIIGLRISILQGSINGKEVFKEWYNPVPQTNMNGLVTVNIGSGYPITGRFYEIDWSQGPYFIKTEIDPTGSSDYSIISTSQLLSVPYALQAKTAESLVGESKAYVDALLDRVAVIEEQLNIVPDSGVFKDARDGTTYKFVKIGDQAWMAENLKYLPDITSGYSSSETEPNYYVNGYFGTDVNEAKAKVNYNTYGVLYNWPAAIYEPPGGNSNPSVVQGVCPAGWHLPSNAEWQQLVDYLGGDSIAGGKLKETGTKHWLRPNSGATNESGFKALPGGSLIAVPDFELGAIRYTGYWWGTSFDDNILVPYLFYLSHDKNNGSLVPWWDNNYDDWPYKSHGFSVRCVKD